MLIKSLTLKRPSGIANLVRYIFDDEKKYIDEQGQELVYRYNMLKGDVESYINQFKENLQSIQDQKGRVQLYHFILSFAPESTRHLNAKKLRQITRKFIGQHSQGTGMYLGVAQEHGDETPHTHIHLLCAGLGIGNKKALRLNKQRFSEVQQVMQNHIKERYPELSASLVNYGLAEKELEQTTQTEYEIKRKGRTSKKQALKQQIESIALQSSCKEEFERLMKEANIQPYLRNGKLTGYRDPQSDRKYRISTLKLQPILATLELKMEEQKVIENDVHHTTSREEQPVHHKTKEAQQPQYSEVIKELEEIRQLSEEQDRQEDLEL
jgi:hypothetical protein